MNWKRWESGYRNQPVVSFRIFNFEACLIHCHLNDITSKPSHFSVTDIASFCQAKESAFNPPSIFYFISICKKSVISGVYTDHSSFHLRSSRFLCSIYRLNFSGHEVDAHQCTPSDVDSQPH